MDVLVNGERQTFDDDAMSLTELLGRMDVAQRKGIAVAINHAVVPQSQWSEAQIQDGDEIEIVRATQGG